MTDNAWRAVLAALSDDRARTAYARLVLGDTVESAVSGMAPSKARRIIETLVAAGLLRADDDTVVPDVFARALASAPRPSRPSGVERYLRDGRLTTYPARAAERHELLTSIAPRVLAPGEVVDEIEMNARLSAVADDVAALRRHLVDASLITRTPSGTSYRLAD